MALAFTKSVNEFRAARIYEGTLDLASVGVAGTAVAEVDLTCTGVLATDMALSFACTDTGMTLGVGNVRVKAADTISVVFLNTDDAAQDLAGTLNFRFICIPAI